MVEVGPEIPGDSCRNPSLHNAPTPPTKAPWEGMNTDPFNLLGLRMVGHQMNLVAIPRQSPALTPKDAGIQR